MLCTSGCVKHDHQCKAYKIVTTAFAAQLTGKSRIEEGEKGLLCENYWLFLPIIYNA